MRLIDADALEPDAEYDEGEYWAYSTTQIENAPTIEPERKKGKWVDVTRTGGCFLYKCSECGNLFLEEYNFCPECGADMREGAEG